MSSSPRLRSAEQAWTEAAAQAPVEPLQAELEADQALRSSLQRDVASSQALLPDSDAATVGGVVSDVALLIVNDTVLLVPTLFAAS